jgi:hypothetical protein
MSDRAREDDPNGWQQLQGATPWSDKKRFRLLSLIAPSLAVGAAVGRRLWRRTR